MKPAYQPARPGMKSELPGNRCRDSSRNSSDIALQASDTQAVDGQTSNTTIGDQVGETFPVITPGKSAPAITNTKKGQESVRRVAALFTRRRYRVKSRLPYNSPFDLLVNGKRVEVKTALLRHTRDGLYWLVNIHRHGELDESAVDVYAIELIAEFLNSPIVLLIPAPIGVKTLWFGPRGLLKGEYAHYVENWSLVEPRAENPTLPELYAAEVQP